VHEVPDRERDDEHSNAFCSTREDDFSDPQFTRPPLRMSSVATRSAIRIGWL
jgi:hypothetical protein